MIHDQRTESDLEILVLWQLIGQVNSLMGAPLWHHHNTANFFHLWIIWRTCAIQITRNLEENDKAECKSKYEIRNMKCLQNSRSMSHLSTQVRDADELLQYILRQNVSVSGFFNVIRRHVDMVGTQVQVGCRDCSTNERIKYS